MDCYTCSGKGYVFGYGSKIKRTCITCQGSGKIPEFKSSTKIYGKSYIKKYLNVSPFDFAEKFEHIQTLDFIGHPTMEIMLLRDRSNFYIGQPNCKGRYWYKIPLSGWLDFKKHYNKVNNRATIL